MHGWNDLIKKYRPAEDQKVVGYTAFVKPIRDVYREEPDVKRMRNIMSILGIIILFYRYLELRTDLHLFTLIPCQSHRRT